MHLRHQHQATQCLVDHQDSENYPKWIFAYSDEAQRNQINIFSLLGYHIELRCYTDRVSPVVATNPDNAGETQLAEWNRVWPLIFPTKIAALGSDITGTVTTINYSDAKPRSRATDRTSTSRSTPRPCWSIPTPPAAPANRAH